MPQETVEIDVEIKHETDLAYLVFDGDLNVWIPKSELIDFNNTDKITSITIPEWLAKDKGLI